MGRNQNKRGKRAIIHKRRENYTPLLKKAMEKEKSPPESVS